MVEAPMPQQPKKPRPKLPADMLALTEQLEPPALARVDIDRLARLVDASPEQFREACAAMFRRLAVEGFREIRPPRNYKELATVVDLWRKLEGLDAKGQAPAIPPGMVGVLRSVGRRQVVDVPAEPTEDAGEQEDETSEEEDREDEENDLMFD